MASSDANFFPRGLLSRILKLVGLVEMAAMDDPVARDTRSSLRRRASPMFDAEIAGSAARSARSAFFIFPA